MKKQLLTLLVASMGLNAMSQSIAKVNSAEINKMSRPCITADYGMSFETIEGALKKKFSDLNLKSPDKTKDGYRVYKGVAIPEITTDKIDLYYRVENRKPNTTIYMLLSRGYDNFMVPEKDSMVYANTIQFLDKFVKDATIFSLNEQIVNQEREIKEADKNIKSIAKDEEGLMKDKSKTEAKISQNTIEQGSLKAEVENQEKLLVELKKKTATLDQMEALKKEVSKQEDAVKKAAKNYNNSIKDGEDYKSDLNKIESKIGDNKIEEDKAKTELEQKNAKLQELKNQLAEISK